VALDQVNRILVHQGLLRIRSAKGHAGIKALVEIAGKNLSALGSSDLGFAIGPRLNAAGRMDDSAKFGSLILRVRNQPCSRMRLRMASKT
jgi:single-stranded DNA-specific DHH superfamily exonuclease